MQRVDRHFPLGIVAEASRDARTTSRWVLSDTGMVAVHCSFRTDGARGHVTFVAPLVERDRIAADVHLPDRRTLAEAGVEFETSCQARVLDSTSAARADVIWRDVPILVTVDTPSCAYQVEWRAGALGRAPTVIPASAP
jgi:hypothetical protein